MCYNLWLLYGASVWPARRRIKLLATLLSPSVMSVKSCLAFIMEHWTCEPRCSVWATSIPKARNRLLSCPSLGPTSHYSLLTGTNLILPCSLTVFFSLVSARMPQVCVTSHYKRRRPLLLFHWTFQYRVEKKKKMWTLINAISVTRELCVHLADNSHLTWSNYDLSIRHTILRVIGLCFCRFGGSKTNQGMFIADDCAKS